MSRGEKTRVLVRFRPDSVRERTLDENRDGGELEKVSSLLIYDINQ